MGSTGFWLCPDSIHRYAYSADFSSDLGDPEWKPDRANVGIFRRFNCLVRAACHYLCVSLSSNIGRALNVTFTRSTAFESSVMSIMSEGWLYTHSSSY